MTTCPGCGGRLHPHATRVIVDPRGVVFERAVDADQCNDCGRGYATDSVWNHRHLYGASRLGSSRPPAA